MSKKWREYLPADESIHHRVFWPAVAFLALFISLTILYYNSMGKFFGQLQESIANTSGWFFVLVVNLILIFCVILAFGKFKRIKIGGKGATPEFSLLAWFAMLFSAGMGIGLLYWSVAEPISHYASPPYGAANSAQSAKISMQFTMLHWGFHAWAIYAIVALALAFFTFNKKLPLTISSVFYPLLGERVHGVLGNAIDTLAVLATIFGLATSLGLGAQQINSGLAFLTEVPKSTSVQVIIIMAITAVATISVVLGLKKGVRRLSELNMIIAALFLVCMLFFGPTLFILNSSVQNAGSYFQELAALGFWTESYQQTDWQNNWTVFYWGWWIAWSPFVGMFIARISKGRTVGEFILGVLIVPTVLTLLWLSTFGGSALYLELTQPGTMVQAVDENVSTALFHLLNHFPFSYFSCALAILLVFSFFVTSSDSGSLVIDSITSGGRLDAPVGQRIFWAVTEGIVASALLIGGGLEALQTASITMGLPFAVALLLMCYCLWRGLSAELKLHNNKNT